MAVVIPTQLKQCQGRMVRGDFYWVDVLLKDGTVHKGLTTNGEEIRGRWDGAGGGLWEAPIPFQTEDIRRLRPHSSWPFFEQIAYLFGRQK